MPAIQAVALTKRFSADEPPALDAVDFRVEAGEITGLVGPDGAGKTTLMRLAAGLLTPTEGVLHVLGTPMPCTKSAFLQQIGYMPQKFGLYEDLSVAENLSLYAALQNVEDAARRIGELLAFTALEDFAQRRAGKLSGGMKQKLGLACALVKKPRVLLLDEPGVGVDPIARKELWQMVRRLLTEGVAVLWGTSYMDEADACDQVILLNAGKVLFAGDPGRMKRRLAGRVFRITGRFADKREAVGRILKNAAVQDAVLVGASIRAVIKEGGTLPAFQPFGGEIGVHSADPTFEDAFTDILGAKIEATSRLAEGMKKIPPSGGHLIEAKGLTKRFGDFVATDHIDLSIGQGEVFGFLGPNGAGKSTTFKMLCGLIAPTEGEARVQGEDLYRAGAKVRNGIGYMAQKFSLYGNLKVRDNLDFFAGIYGLSGRRKRQKIDEMIDLFELRRHLKTKTDALPLGLKQRLALACSVMHEPPILFLDEPTSGVDPLTRKEFWTHINGMVKKGVSIMVTTHFMDEAEYCDRIMLIYRGKAIAVGTPDALKARVSDGRDRNVSMEETFIELVGRYDREQR